MFRLDQGRPVRESHYESVGCSVTASEPSLYGSLYRSSDKEKLSRHGQGRLTRYLGIFTKNRRRRADQSKHRDYALDRQSI